jgi:probable phosphomutase (TIGR03848 family)
MSVVTNLLLVRHAQNDWVRSHRLPGLTPGVHLNAEGQAQAEALATRLREVPLTAIYSSPLERAVETARPLAEVHGLELQIRDGLAEVDVGQWTGQVLKELAQTEEWRDLMMWPAGFRFPEGERTAHMQARMAAELDAIRGDHPDQTIAVVSHADPLKAAVAHYLGLPMDLFQRLVIEPASVTILQFRAFGPSLLRLSDTGDLPSLRPPPAENGG